MLHRGRDGARDGSARLHMSFFQPSFRLQEKPREAVEVIKHYHPPATPYERALACPAPSRVSMAGCAMNFSRRPCSSLPTTRADGLLDHPTTTFVGLTRRSSSLRPMPLTFPQRTIGYVTPTSCADRLCCIHATWRTKPGGSNRCEMKSVTSHPVYIPLLTSSARSFLCQGN